MDSIHQTRRREQRNRAGVYVPQAGITYPEKPDEQLLQPRIVRDVALDESYPYLDSSLKARLLHLAIYAGIFTFVFPLHVLRYGLKIEGRENLRRNRRLFRNGAMTVANHVYRWDFLAVLQAVRYRRLWFPTKGWNVNTPDAALIRGVGGIPIPAGRAALRQFNSAFDALHARRKWLHVFPESCRWDWYQPIRPFRLGTFSMAARYGLPVIPMAFSYREPSGWRRLLGIRHPLVTLRIGTPVVADPQLRRKDAARQMLHEAHRQMCALAGIEENCWDALGS